VTNLIPDFAKEDQYECECGRCGNHYLGQKRSSTCPECKLKAERCYYCAMGSPQILLSDGMYGHEISCNQAFECGNQPSIRPAN